MSLMDVAKKLYEFRNILLTRAGVNGYRQTESGEWVCDPASQAFNDLGKSIDATHNLQEANGGYWGEHPEILVEDWQYDVMENNTRLGYWEWVQARIDGEDTFR